MSPHPPRHPSPASGDVAAAAGRHRRPESLADEAPTFRASTLLESETWVPGPRSARHQRPASRRDGRAIPSSRTAAHRAPSHRTATERPPLTGSHRAPGTLPLESWLLMGKKRQQVLLAALVAVGLLLVAVPGARPHSSFDAINAAARATGAHTGQKAHAGGSGTNDSDGGKGSGTRKTPTASAAPTGTDVPTVRPTGPARRDANLGPGNSLRITGTTAVALTFDDGPDPVQTPRILALLSQYDVKATFCLVGQQVHRHPEIVREIVAAGHTLCNHTWNHSLTIGKDKPEKIKADLEKTSAEILAAVPGAKIPFFRAPGGNFTDRLVGVAAQQGMTSLYWQVDPQDWDHKTGETDAAHVARVIDEVKKHVRPGSIVLSHDFNQPDTIAAYQKLLPWLRDNFTLGIPGEPVAGPTTPPTTEPTPSPTETPTTPAPSTSSSPAAAAAAVGDEEADAR